jgi:uncharacterized Ntn-hydrolase superfamily protein
MTLSIVARCARTKQFGIAIASSSLAVAARCAHVRAGVGAVASQNVTDPSLGPRGLDLMGGGASATEALAALRAGNRHIDFRQLCLVDQKGGVASFSGARTLGIHTRAEGDGVAAAGNMLANELVISAMMAAFERSRSGPLAERLLEALAEGVAAGGEMGPIFSAGLLVADTVSWPVTDLRVDWDERPLAALRKLWTLWAPQAEAYVQRALNPLAAPSFGVSGDP